MDEFDHYLRSLVGSWQALAAPHPSAKVVRAEGFIACWHPNPVFNNGVILSSGAVGPARRVFNDVASFALWCRDDDTETAMALEALEFRRDVTTRPMRCDLGRADLEVSLSCAVIDVDVALVAELNGLPGDVLVGVPGARGFASEGREAGLVLIPVGSDANVSFVATRPDARRRGLATAVTVAALRHARDRGATTASLQATPMAEQLYTSIGFEPVARWQEWLPPG